MIRLGIRGERHGERPLRIDVQRVREETRGVGRVADGGLGCGCGCARDPEGRAEGEGGIRGGRGIVLRERVPKMRGKTKGVGSVADGGP